MGVILRSAQPKRGLLAMHCRVLSPGFESKSASALQAAALYAFVDAVRMRQ